MKISRLLKIKCFRPGALNSSVHFQETAWLSRVLVVLEFIIFVKAQACGFHSIVCKPALCAQTPVPAVHSGENLCAPFERPGREGARVCSDLDI